FNGFFYPLIFASKPYNNGIGSYWDDLAVDDAIPRTKCGAGLYIFVSTVKDKFAPAVVDHCFHLVNVLVSINNEILISRPGDNGIGEGNFQLAILFYDKFQGKLTSSLIGDM